MTLSLTRDHIAKLEEAILNGCVTDASMAKAVGIGLSTHSKWKNEGFQVAERITRGFLNADNLNSQDRLFLDYATAKRAALARRREFLTQLAGATLEGGSRKEVIRYVVDEDTGDETQIGRTVTTETPRVQDILNLIQIMDRNEAIGVQLHNSRIKAGLHGGDILELEPGDYTEKRTVVSLSLRNVPASVLPMLGDCKVQIDLAEIEFDSAQLGDLQEALDAEDSEEGQGLPSKTLA